MQKTSGKRRPPKRWIDYRPSKTQMLWIAVGCILATLIAGFGFGGWVTADTAQKMVSQAAERARHELATAVCVEEFTQGTDAAAQLEKLKSTIWYQRDDLVAAAGWATMPDRKEPNRTVAGMCASRLAELQPQALAESTPTSRAN
jgi:hypothetical protein